MSHYVEMELSLSRGLTAPGIHDLLAGTYSRHDVGENWPPHTKGCPWLVLRATPLSFSNGRLGGLGQLKVPSSMSMISLLSKRVTAWLSKPPDMKATWVGTVIKEINLLCNWKYDNTSSSMLKIYSAQPFQVRILNKYVEKTANLDFPSMSSDRGRNLSMVLFPNILLSSCTLSHLRCTNTTGSRCWQCRDRGML